MPYEVATGSSGVRAYRIIYKGPEAAAIAMPHLEIWANDKVPIRFKKLEAAQRRAAEWNASGQPPRGAGAFRQPPAVRGHNHA